MSDAIKMPRASAPDQRQRIRGTIMNQLPGKIAVVSGACSSIGRGIAIRFALDGAKTALIDTDETKGAEIVAQIKSAGGSAEFFRADVAAKNEARRAVDAVAKTFGGLYVLANCNWRQTPWTAFADKAADDFATTLDRSVVGAVRCMQAAFPHMKRGGGGRVINVGSPYGATTYIDVGDAVAADWALQGITRAAAVEWGQHNVLVNYLAPAAVDIPEFQAYRKANPASSDRVLRATTLRRLGDVIEDIGGAAMYLASDEACFVNGHPIYADGGQFLNAGLFAPGVKYS